MQTLCVFVVLVELLSVRFPYCKSEINNSPINTITLIVTRTVIEHSFQVTTNPNNVFLYAFLNNTSICVIN